MLVEALRERCCADNASLAAARTRQEAGASQWRLATGGAAERVETRSGFFFFRSGPSNNAVSSQVDSVTAPAKYTPACLPVCQCASWPPRAALGIAVGCGRVKVERSQRVCGCVGVALSQLASSPFEVDHPSQTSSTTFLPRPAQCTSSSAIHRCASGRRGIATRSRLSRPPNTSRSQLSSRAKQLRPRQSSALVQPLTRAKAFNPTSPDRPNNPSQPSIS